MNITIRAVDDPASCRAIEQLQQQIWGSQPEEVVPYHQLLTAAHYGGTLLVAYDGDQMVGFAYGFAGLDQGRPVLCSHMLGVLPAYRSRQIGYRLKMAQRDEARRAGYDRMIWTFDPLESRNAYLNLHKLGAFAETYSVNHYGDMQDELNRGLPSDRLLADWRFGAGEHRPQVPPGDVQGAPVLNPAAWDDGLARPGPVDPAPLASSPVVKVAVPGNTAHLRQASPETARAWRFSVREALTTAFAHGYRAVDLVPPPSSGSNPAAGPTTPAGAAVAYYILTRHTSKGEAR